MPAYLTIQIKFTAPEGRVCCLPRRCWAARGGVRGRYLIAGGAKVDVLEGSHDGRSLVIFEFPSMERLHEFWSSPRYADVMKLREGWADLDVWAAPGFQLAGS